MKSIGSCLALITAVLFVEAPLPQLTARAQPPATLRHMGTIPLPNVSGRIDHLTFDAARQHLFVAALGNNTVEVVDAAKNAYLQSLPNFHEPQGIAVVPDTGGVAVANGSSGTLQFLDAQSFQTRWTVTVGGDADNVRYDGVTKRLYVAADGGLYTVDPASGKIVGQIHIDGHPESFQLESANTRVFANMPGIVSSQIVAADRSHLSIIARWSSLGCNGNYPMALDEPTSRLFIGCRRPARVAMLDVASGKVVAASDIVGDTDDLFYDGARQRLYIIGGGGRVDVLQRHGDTIAPLTPIETRAGARTGLWVEAASRLYVAVPARGGASAEIRVFAPDAVNRK
jgi:DNA-binding beta-propeller fold protein YncE